MVLRQVGGGLPNHRGVADLGVPSLLVLPPPLLLQHGGVLPLPLLQHGGVLPLPLLPRECVLPPPQGLLGLVVLLGELLRGLLPLVS